MSEQQVEKKEKQTEQQIENQSVQQKEPENKPSRRGQNLSEYKTIRVKKELYDKVKTYIDSLKNQSEQEKSIGDQLKNQTDNQLKKKSDNSWIALLVIGLLGLFLLLSPYILPKLGISIEKGESNE